MIGFRIKGIIIPRSCDNESFPDRSLLMSTPSGAASNAPATPRPQNNNMKMDKCSVLLPSQFSADPRAVKAVNDLAQTMHDALKVGLTWPVCDTVCSRLRQTRQQRPIQSLSLVRPSVLRTIRYVCGSDICRIQHFVRPYVSQTLRCVREPICRTVRLRHQN